MSFTLPKAERINSKIIIDKLFSGGNTAMSVFPLRAIFMTEPKEDGDAGASVQMMVSVSKRRLHRAVDRNRQKRQIRESYRLNKSELIEFCEQNGLRVYIAFVSLAEEPCSRERIERSMVKLLRKTIEKLG